MLVELKWLIPACAAVAIAVIALMRGQIDSIPWSRAFIIASSLVIATTPIITSGEIGTDGLKITTALGQTAADSAVAIQKLDERISTIDKRLVEVRGLLAEFKTVLPASTSPESKQKVDAQIRELSELAAKSAEAKKQFDIIKQSLDHKVIRLPGVKLPF